MPQELVADNHLVLSLAGRDIHEFLKQNDLADIDAGRGAADGILANQQAYRGTMQSPPPNVRSVF